MCIIDHVLRGVMLGLEHAEASQPSRTRPRRPSSTAAVGPNTNVKNPAHGKDGPIHPLAHPTGPPTRALPTNGKITSGLSRERVSDQHPEAQNGMASSLLVPRQWEFAIW